MGHVCPWWLAYTFDNPLRRLFHRPDRIFSSHVREGQIAADIGCGMGYFSIALAKIVKNTGKVYSIDIQSKMLDTLKKRADKEGVSSIIHPQLSDSKNLIFKEPVDFALTFWMVHETEDKREFLKEIYDGLKINGLLLITEPKFHVSRREFDKEISIAKDVGFKIICYPEISFSNSALLNKA